MLPTKSYGVSRFDWKLFNLSYSRLHGTNSTTLHMADDDVSKSTKPKIGNDDNFPPSSTQPKFILRVTSSGN